MYQCATYIYILIYTYIYIYIYIYIYTYMYIWTHAYTFTYAITYTIGWSVGWLVGWIQLSRVGLNWNKIVYIIERNRFDTLIDWFYEKSIAMTRQSGAPHIYSNSFGDPSGKKNTLSLLALPGNK